ncbi:MAG: phosphorylase, partial [Trichodesmium sp. St19_bin1]|nr:phosphorylase [Trichodesmium sp. St19_bin1]
SAKPNVFVAPIAAGEKVVANKKSDLFEFLQQNYGDALAVEMEGRGILEAVHANQQVSGLIIRGISDLIDGKSRADKEGFQELAASHASAFAFQVLAKLGVGQEHKSNSANNSLKKKQKNPDFFAYDDAWVGRESLINELTNKVKGSCRLLILVGMTGIGKTALGERLAVELEDWFFDWNYYLQENFEYEEQTSDFGSVAVRLLEKCGEVVTPDDRKDTQRLMYRLVRHLQENRYLIQLDSLNNILQGNEEEGWSNFKDEWWVKFITTWLNVDTCESCLILTSQDLPAQIPSVGTRSQNFWLCQPLSGLEKLEQLALFKKGGLDVSEAAEGTPYLEKIGKAYEGHPLALRVIAGEIVNRPFNGNVLGYWNKYGKEVEEVEKAIEEPKTQGIIASTDNQFNLHNFTKNL